MLKLTIAKTPVELQNTDVGRESFASARRPFGNTRQGTIIYDRGSRHEFLLRTASRRSSSSGEPLPNSPGRVLFETAVARLRTPVATDTCPKVRRVPRTSFADNPCAPVGCVRTPTVLATPHVPEISLHGECLSASSSGEVFSIVANASRPLTGRRHFG